MEESLEKGIRWGCQFVVYMHCQERRVFFGETTCAYDFELGYIDLEAESEGEGADNLYLPLKGDVRW